MSEPAEQGDNLESLFQFPDHVPYEPGRERPLPGISPVGSMAPRYIAAFVDNLLAFVVAGVAAKSLPQQWVVAQTITAVLGYFGYYFVTEALTSMTPGKYFTGVKVYAFDGGRCTLRQVLIRTLFRVIEVNPFGTAIISAISIVATRDRQRLGDMVAGTVVALRSRVPT